MKLLLSELRKEYKLNQQGMADKLLISYSHYVKLENGFVKPSFNLLKRIKRSFPEVDMNELFK